MQDKMQGCSAEINSLIESLTKSRLVVVVGTGVSMALTNARFSQLSWTGLIRSGLIEASETGRLIEGQLDRWQAQLGSDDVDELISCAEFVTRKLEGPDGLVYSRWLEKSFCNLIPSNPDLERALLKLARCGARYCTLNYDTLLSSVLGVGAISLGDQSRVAEWMRSDNESVLHLHGKWDAPETCVLGARDYERAGQSPLRDLLQHALAANCQLMFVGCGDTFGDPNFKNLAKWLGSTMRGRNLQHFALVKRLDFERRRKDVDWRGFVEPLVYGEEYSDLAPFIIGLAGDNEIKRVSDNERMVRESAFPEIITRYKQYVVRDCGQMTIEGVRADMDTAQRRFDIERLFVPLNVSLCPPEFAGDSQEREELLADWKSKNPSMEFGECFSKNKRIAILALPGGGKTLLLKRLAVAYADPVRRSKSRDGLPDIDIVPVMIRCRDWRDHIRDPIIGIISKIFEITGQPELRGLGEALLPVFKSGGAVLLIDGLDEIHDAADRELFVDNVDRFVSDYPDVRVVVTSREAGFNLVAPAISRFCSRIKVSPLDEDGIRTLCVYWHQLMMGDASDYSQEGEAVALMLLSRFSLQRLAENPLLLTMLLVVKNGAGRLPPDRVSLYERAVEVLLDTWNIKGHEPLNPKEAVPQLACIAFEMMRRGMQTATERDLLGILENAGEQIPQIKRYAKSTPDEFLKRVELRSSLLLEAGHQMEGARLVPFYQFRHLTFQEYLAAVAVAERYVLDYQQVDSIAAPIKDCYDSKEWKEVIPMAAVMARKQADPILNGLLDRASNARRRVLNKPNGNARGRTEVATPHSISVLVQCLVEEVVGSTDVLTAIFEQIAYFGNGCRSNDAWVALAKGPYGEELIASAYRYYESMSWPVGHWIRNTVASLTAFRARVDGGFSDRDANEIARRISSSDRYVSCLGLLSIVGNIWHGQRDGGYYSAGSVDLLLTCVEVQIVAAKDDVMLLSAVSAWAFLRAHHEEDSASSVYLNPSLEVLDAVMQGSFSWSNAHLRETVCYALSTLRIPRDYWRPEFTKEEAADILSPGSSRFDYYISRGQMSLAYYGGIISDRELLKKYSVSRKSEMYDWIKGEISGRSREIRLQ